MFITIIILTIVVYFSLLFYTVKLYRMNRLEALMMFCGHATIAAIVVYGCLIG